ncbi:ribonuclease HII [Synergistales bacterium]|nr:ribonuclease HII [Synergistales bacterium]
MRVIAGVDEAGRGPIAGPVMAAAAILTPPQFRALLKEGLNDSKKLNERTRERLFARMNELGVVWRAQGASHRRIDSTNILRATLWAMSKSIAALPLKPELIVVDGSVYIPDIDKSTQRVIPKADGKIPSVMAASVIAKTLRDRIMRTLDTLYPGYGFASHKGYPTKEHRRALDTLGASPIHRLSFGGYSKTPIKITSGEENWLS